MKLNGIIFLYSPRSFETGCEAALPASAFLQVDNKMRTQIYIDDFNCYCGSVKKVHHKWLNDYKIYA
jgi:hypothetical protein